MGLISKGFFVLSVPVPNIIWTLEARPAEIEDISWKHRRDLRAMTCGLFGVFGVFAAMIQSFFVSYERFCAIKWPLLTMNQSTKKIGIKIVSTWIFTVVATSYVSK